MSLPAGVEITAEITPEFSEVLTHDALAFVAKLQREFGARRDEALERRKDRQLQFDAGEMPDFLAETKHIRESDWTCAPSPKDLQDRRVEITGPTDRKMVINALNSGAKMFMADFEDANSPTWRNMVEGQINLRDAIRRKITFRSPEGKEYKLNAQTAVLLGISRATVFQQIRRGVLQATREGHRWRIAAAEVERYRADHLGTRDEASSRHPYRQGRGVQQS